MATRKNSASLHGPSLQESPSREPAGAITIALGGQATGVEEHVAAATAAHQDWAGGDVEVGDRDTASIAPIRTTMVHGHCTLSLSTLSTGRTTMKQAAGVRHVEPAARSRVALPPAAVLARQRANAVPVLTGNRRRRWLPIVCAAMVVAGCGSSSGSDNTSTGGTPTNTATGTVTVATGDLEHLPQVPAAAGSAPRSSGGDTRAFLRQVFENAEAMWHNEFQGAGVTYRPARLTIFNHEVQTACGTHSAAVGPFYCPASFGVYLDTRFFTALSQKVGVGLGDFAQAYVVAHELGHHVQTLLGITQQKAIADHHDPAGSNARSVRFELQADCFAGVWMHSAYKQGELTEADLRDALNAAAVVGDDFLRNASGGSRPPEEWTHGSSAQRQHWLTTGFSEGRPAACDTFSS